MSKNSYTITPTGMLMFPLSVVNKFTHANKSLRWGQAFHQYMKLEKCVQDKNFCDKLYNEPDNHKAINMVASRTDHNN